MPLILGTNSIKDTGYNVANSVRLNNADNAYFSQTPSSSSGTTFTYSMWIKRGRIGLNGYLIRMVASDNSEADLVIESDKIRIQEYNGTSGANKWKYITNRVFRDPSTWMHILYVVDTNNGTASDRVRLYINGVRETSFSTATNPSSGATSCLATTGARTFGGKASAGSFDGYMAECVYVDGTAKSTTDFGEFDEDSPTIWKPIDVSSMSLGSTGWYLDFEDSSSLGNDASGSNNWTSNNLAATDQSTDTCTNNFATLNALATGLDATLSEGNLKMASGTATTRSGTASTIGLSQGKWFAEFKITQSANGIVGIAGTTQNKSATDDDDIGNYPGRTQQGYGYLSGGDVYNDSSAVTGSFASFTTNDIIGVAVDLDNNLLYFYKNGTVQNSGTGIDISGITTQSGNWFFAVGDGSGSTASTVECNFGSPPYSISSGNADGNGYGNFEYAVPSGYFSLCTKNLAEYG